MSEKYTNEKIMEAAKRCYKLNFLPDCRNCPLNDDIIYSCASRFAAALLEKEKHGHWIKVGETNFCDETDYFITEEKEIEEKCSFCGRRVYRYDGVPQDRYCPECGKKMDKEVTNGTD